MNCVWLAGIALATAKPCPSGFSRVLFTALAWIMTPVCIFRVTVMAITFKPLGSVFVAEVSPIDLRQARDRETLMQLRAGMDQYAVLVFRNQPFTNEEQLDFAQRFDGTLHAKTSVAVLAKNRFGNEALTDISNVNAQGDILAANDRLRASTVSNRLWHTDASFENPAGRYSMLSARVLPPVRADTEFADMRAAYDALDTDTQRSLEGLQVYHSIVYSRHVLGFEFGEEERARLKGAVHPLVRTLPSTGRRSLYLASHAQHIEDMPVPEGRLLLRDLIEHATQAQFTYRHEWQPQDLVIWDNRTTMHRARPFEDKKYRRELCRTTTLDLPFEIAA
jgi:alpha-ketoglutarate-dependent 2,4-dichlorophenoxyacetate dioxygenase